MMVTVSKNMQEYIWKIKSAFECNRMTLIIIVLYTIWEAAIAAIPYEYYWDFHFFVDVTERALRYLIIPSLFIETYFAESKVKSVCGYVIAIIISGAVAACGDLYIFSKAAINSELPVQILEILPVGIQQIAGPRGTLFKVHVELFLCAALLILSVAVIYKSFKKTQLLFKEYVAKIFRNVAKSLLILIILEICCAYVDSTMANEFFYQYYFEYTEQIYGTILVMGFYLGPVGVLVMGFYLGPEMIFTLRGMDEKPGKIRYKIAKKILPVFILCAIGTAYVCFCMILIAFWRKCGCFPSYPSCFALRCRPVEESFAIKLKEQYGEAGLTKYDS